MKNVKKVVALILAFIAVVIGVLLINKNTSKTAPTEPTQQHTTSEEAPTSEVVIGETFVGDLKDSGRGTWVTFEHTKPGEYSEIFVSLSVAEPGEEVEVTLIGDTDESNTRIATADEHGHIYEVFRVFEYGHYSVRAIPSVSGTVYISGVEVQ